MGGVTKAERSRSRRYAQPLLQLDGKAVSDEAKALASHCLKDHVLPKLPVQRPTSLQRVAAATEATIAGLIVAEQLAYGGGWLRRPLSSGSFTEEPVGRTHFMKVLRALSGEGIIEIVRGFHDPTAGPTGHSAHTRLRLTAKGRQLAADYGVTSGDDRLHFASSILDDG